MQITCNISFLQFIEILGVKQHCFFNGWLHASEYTYFSLTLASNLRSSIFGFFVVILEGMEVVMFSPDSLKVAKITSVFYISYSACYILENGFFYL